MTDQNEKVKKKKELSFVGDLNKCTDRCDLSLEENHHTSPSIS